MEKRFVWAVFLLFLAALAFKCHYLGRTPFIEDETLYAQMIAEEAESPSFLPTYFGMPAPWKPGLYYFTYSLFLPITLHLFGSPEWAYRFPNLLFSAASAFLVFSIAKRFAGRDTAIFASLLFFSSISCIYAETRLLMEPLTLALMLASLSFYVRENPKKADFLTAGLFALLAALTKSVISLAIPLLAVAYFLGNGRDSLKSPWMLLSLIGAPLGIAVFFLMLLPTGFAYDIFLIDTGRAVLYDYSESAGTLLRNASNIFGFIFLFLVSAFAFAARRRKVEPMLLAWALLILIPIAASTFRIWYTYYFIPPLSILSAMAMLDGKRADSFSVLLLCLFVAISLIVFSVSFIDWESGQYAPLLNARELGISLAGDNSTLFVGRYYYNSIVICYKALEERRLYGGPMDFGYVLVRDPQETGGFDAYAREFIEDYGTEKYPVEDVRFAQFFWNGTPFRKGTPIGEFNTVVSSPPLGFPPQGYALNYTDGYAAVYVK